jgi:hypothetical protein
VTAAGVGAESRVTAARVDARSRVTAARENARDGEGNHAGAPPKHAAILPERGLEQAPHLGLTVDHGVTMAQAPALQIC